MPVMSSGDAMSVVRTRTAISAIIAMPGIATVEINQVSKIFRGKEGKRDLKALDRATLAVRQGEFGVRFSVPLAAENRRCSTS